MPFVGKWGVFIHIPKTGGQWMRRVLKKYDPEQTWYQIPDTHTLPKTLEGIEDQQWWTIVRHPAEWLRSYWAHRCHESGATKRFSVKQSKSEIWMTLCALTLPHMNWDLEKFTLNVVTELPGLVSWFYHYYLAPNVKAVRLDDVNEFLAQTFDIHNPQPKLNTSKVKMKKELPEISPKMRRIIRASEIALYETFNWEA